MWKLGRKNNASVSALAGEEKNYFCPFNISSQIPNKTVFQFSSFVQRPQHPIVFISVRDRALRSWKRFSFVQRIRLVLK